MTTEELRELDAWIAEHVTGWVIYKTTDEWRRAGHPTGLKITVLDQRPRFDISKYTTDPAAAMEVLKKAILHLKKEPNFGFKVEIWWAYDALEWCVGCKHDRFYGQDENLETAICLFAQKIFSV